MDEAKICGGDLTSSRWSWLLWGVPAALLGLSAWAGGLFQGIAWPLSFSLMGGSCFANARGCKRTHCHVTGPLYLVAALASIPAALVWPFLYWIIAIGAAVGTGGAYAWEWRRGKYLEAPFGLNG